MIKVFLVESNYLLRLGVKSLINSQEDIKVVAEFSSPQEALAEVPQYNPHLIISDILFREGNKMAFIEQIKQRCRECKVMIFTTHREKSTIERAINAQIDGYLHKDVPARELIECIRMIFKEHKYFSKDIAQIIINDLVEENHHKDLFRLSKREREVLRLISDGFTNTQIGEKLFIATKTVNKHRANLLNKMDVKNTAELVKVAMQNNLI